MSVFVCFDENSIEQLEQVTRVHVYTTKGSITVWAHEKILFV